ncbi:unnamed protein product, partial [Timema podura]|nr:unnamed protein product [Timema podura]
MLPSNGDTSEVDLQSQAEHVAAIRERADRGILWQWVSVERRFSLSGIPHNQDIPLVHVLQILLHIINLLTDIRKKDQQIDSFFARVEIVSPIWCNRRCHQNLKKTRRRNELSLLHEKETRSDQVGDKTRSQDIDSIRITMKQNLCLLALAAVLAVVASEEHPPHMNMMMNNMKACEEEMDYESFRRSDRDSSPNLHVINRPVLYESDALDHSATEAVL